MFRRPDHARRSIARSGRTELAESDALSHKTAEERLNIVNDVLAKLKTLNSPAERFRYYLASRAILGGEKLFQAEAAVTMRDVSPNWRSAFSPT